MQVRLGKALHPPRLLVQSRGGCCCWTALPWRLLVPDCHPQICWRVGGRMWVLRKVVRWIKQGSSLLLSSIAGSPHRIGKLCFISIWLTDERCHGTEQMLSDFVGCPTWGWIRERANARYPHEPNRIREALASFLGHLCKAPAGESFYRILPSGELTYFFCQTLAF